MDLSMRSRLALVLAGVVVVSVVAQAAMMVVQDAESTDLIRGERYDLNSALHVSESSIDVVPADADAEGTANAPLELTAETPEGHTELEQDHWQYTVLLEEEHASALATGQFEVELLLSGDGMENEPVGSVYVGQEEANESEVERARLSWDLGSELPENPLFVIKTHPHTPTGKTASITLESAYDATQGGYIWKGVGGDIDGETNPHITVEAGTTVTFTIRHGCGDGDTAPHNFGLDGSDGSRVVTSDDVNSCGDEAEVTWTAPDQAGDFSYQCDYHPDTMTGSLEVTPAGDEGGSDDGGDDGDGGSALVPDQPASTSQARALGGPPS